MHTIVHKYIMQVYQRKRKYRLYAIFMSASMIHPGKKQVEFEVSIGKVFVVKMVSCPAD